MGSSSPIFGLNIKNIWVATTNHHFWEDTENIPGDSKNFPTYPERNIPKRPPTPIVYVSEFLWIIWGFSRVYIPGDSIPDPTWYPTRWRSPSQPVISGQRFFFTIRFLGTKLAVCCQVFVGLCPPSQDDSGKWRFSSGFPIKNIFLILVVTSQHPGRGHIQPKVFVRFFLGFGFFFWKDKPIMILLLMAEIPNNHLGWC